MQPGRVFAVLMLLLAGTLLVQGYLLPALLLAVFGVLVFAAPHVRGGRSNDEGLIGEAGASMWPSSRNGNSVRNRGDSGSETGGGSGGGSDDGGGDWDGGD